MHMTTEIKIDQFDYPLPDERIASHPLEQRDSCKLLVRHNDGSLSDAVFHNIGDYLPDNALLVCNNTRVINARLRFNKGTDNTGALIEIFCLEPETPADYAVNFASRGVCSWKCFVGNSKRWKSGILSLPVYMPGGDTVILHAERIAKINNTSSVRFSWENDEYSFSEIIDVAGEIPIPPYLNRSTEQSDLTDYQTVFSRIEGSVAAPTAGLHFTPALLENLEKQGVSKREVTLHVGAGTFQPVKTESVADHEMHSEFISAKKDLIEELSVTDRPVYAVGTTSVRTLESLYQIGRIIHSTGLMPKVIDQWYPYSSDHVAITRKEAFSAILDYMQVHNMETIVASTKIIIVPGYNYRAVDGIITNFHQPKSTLLLLVSAFTGGDWINMYTHALENGYRFLSYGDACLLIK